MVLWSLIWWFFVLAAGWQAGRAWGLPSALATGVGLLVVSWVLPLGWWLSIAGACVIGYRAEMHNERLLTG